MISLNFLVSVLIGALPGFKLGDSVGDEYFTKWDENIPKAVKVSTIGLTILGFYVAGCITKFLPSQRLSQKVTNLSLQMMLGGLAFICQMLFWVHLGEQFRAAEKIMVYI